MKEARATKTTGMRWQIIAICHDLELTERVEVNDETLPYAEEDWDCPDQTVGD